MTARPDVMRATRALASAVQEGETIPKDAQRFLRSPNKRAGADPAWIEWLDIDPSPTVSRPMDRDSMSNGVLDKLNSRTNQPPATP